MNQSNPYAEENELSLPRSHGGLFGKIIACVLSFILGIIAAVGGVIGAGYFVTTQPTSTVADTISGLLGADFDYTEFIDSSYGDKQILELVTDVYNAAIELSDSTASLEKLSKISPKVKELATTVKNMSTEFGLTVTEEEVLTTPFGEMIDFFKDRLNDTPAGDVLSSFGMESPLLMALCYGEEGVDYVKDSEGTITMLGGSEKTLIKDLLDDDLSNVFDKIALDTVFTDLDPENPDDDMMFALAYGERNTTYKIVNDDSEQGYHVEMQQVYYYKNGDEFTDYDHNKADVLSATPIAEFSDAYTLLLQVGTDESGTPITETQYVNFSSETNTYLAFQTYDETTHTLSSPVLYKKTKLSDLTSDASALLDKLYLKDILHIDAKSNKVLINLAYGTENVDYFINTSGNIVMINGSMPHTLGYLKTHKDDLIDSVCLEDVLKPDLDSNIVLYMLYGTKGLHYEIQNEGTENATVKMLPAFVYLRGGEIYDEYENKLAADTYTLDGLKYTKNGHTYQLQQSEDATKSDLYYLYLNGEKTTFQPTTLGDLSGDHNPLSDFQKHLSLADVLGESSIEDHKIFKNLKDTKIADIPDATKNLTVKDIFYDDITKTGTEGNEIPTGTWKYLLKKDGTNGTQHEDYNWDLKILDGMNALMENMQRNIHNATLKELSDDNIITGLGGTIDKEVKSEISIKVVTTSYTKQIKNLGSIQNKIDAKPAGEKLTLGELTVNETCAYLNAIFTAFDELASGNIS